jgi:hypothetical protein
MKGKEMFEYVDASNEEVMAVGEKILDKHVEAFKALAK